MLHAKLSLTKPLMRCQVKDISQPQGVTLRCPYARGCCRRIASCCGGRTQQTLMAADIYSIKQLICIHIFCCVHTVLAVCQPSVQPHWFFGFGGGFSLTASHNRINFGSVYLLSIFLDQSSVSWNWRSTSITGVRLPAYSEEKTNQK